jgi:hypothetical protein
VRPFHGIRWFENEGDYPWTQHEMVVMPGAHRAQAADMDADGDLDVVACAFLPDAEHPSFHSLDRQGDLAHLTSLGWFEQLRPGVFEPRTLETGRLTHTTLDLGDYDEDGDADILLGNFVGFTFAESGTGFQAEGWVEIWENQGRGPVGEGAESPLRR